ncbi:MAG: DnaJ domain-containing protein [Bacteroidota bacterium]
MSNIEKSSVIVQKEQELQGLQKQKKKLLTQLKRNETTLTKLKNGIMDMQRQVTGRIPEIMMEIQRVKERLGDLFRKAKTSDKINDSEKEGLDEFIEVFDAENPFKDMFGIDMEEFEAKRASAGFNTDEFDRQKAYEFFSEYKVETKAEDQKEIRKAFIRLANRFHPDKAKSRKEKEQFHALMQQINSAYERNDLANLIRIEEKYGDKKTLAEMEVTQEGAIIDLLDVEIDRLKRNVELLENQLKRMKKEIRNIKSSELGKAYKMEQDAQKYDGESAEDMIEIMEVQKQELLELEEAMKVYLETGKMPEIIQEKFFEPTFDDYNPFQDGGEAIGIEELLEAFSEMMEDDDYDPPVPKKRKKRRRK